MTQVRLGSTPGIRVQISPNANTVVLKNQIPISASTLTGLTDVVVDSTSNGSILIYDSADNKFHQQAFNPLSSNTPLDGGSF